MVYELSTHNCGATVDHRNKYAKSGRFQYVERDGEDNRYRQYLLHNAQDLQATTIDIGDVYLNELANKTKYQNFSLVFSNCEGLAKDQATVTLSPQTGCDGASSTGGGFRNALASSNNDAATGVSIEVWTTNQPEGQGSVQLNCKTKPTSIVDLTGASGVNVVHWWLSSRIVVAADNTIADVRAGQFSTNAVFSVTYE